MFGLEQGQTSNGNSLESQSFLYSASEGLLGGALLTPDPDPRFDGHDTKIQDSSFGEYDGLGLYAQYNDSGPSSIQFGDGTGTSDQSENHVTAKDEVTGRRIDGVYQSIDHSFQHGQSSAESSLTPQFPSLDTRKRKHTSSVLSPSVFPDVPGKPSISSGKAQPTMMAAETSVLESKIQIFLNAFH
jgi:hypothetical protein